MSEMESAAFVEKLRKGVGAQGPPSSARDVINQAMIRHWCDAMRDYNPIYTDPDAASRSVHGEIVAPPPMLNAWLMQGLLPPHVAAKSRRGGDPAGGVYGQLDAAGFTSVVATNSEHEYPRYLRLGEQLRGFSSLKDVSEEKHTGLGTGHFVTSETDYLNDHDELVGRMLFRILKFKPGTGRTAPASSGGGGGPSGQQPSKPEPSHEPGPERRETTLRFDDVEVGTALAPCPIPITATLIVAAAIASRDYQDVHHDRELAIERGSPDIFMNILTTSGLCGRYVGDWAGPEALMRRLAIRLGAPNYPHDTMTMEGSVTSKEKVDGAGHVEIGLRGYNRLGNHVTGTLELELPLD
jgi:acyl dehydratase